MLDFRKVTLKDRELIHQNLYSVADHGCEFSFVNLFCWAEQYVAFYGVTPLFLCRYGRWYTYLLPQCADLKGAIDLLRADAKERGIRFRLFGIMPAEVTVLDALYPHAFYIRSVRDSFDYVYDIVRLTTLRGRKLQAKRNHCNHFEQIYPNYRVLPLTPEMIPRCIEFTEQWYDAHISDHPYSDITEEKTAIEKAFRFFDELHMQGIAIETDEGIVAFSMGNRTHEDTFDVNFEKARSDINGAYPIVNREFARLIHARYPEIKYLNREDDMGIEGLRRAKESYFPDILLEKYVAEERK